MSRSKEEAASLQGEVAKLTKEVERANAAEKELSTRLAALSRSDYPTCSCTVTVAHFRPIIHVR